MGALYYIWGMGNIILLEDYYKLDLDFPAIAKPQEGNILLLNDTYPFPMPAMPQKESDYLNYDKKIEDQYFVRQGPPKKWDSMTPKAQSKWIDEESTRCFETGQWVIIKGMRIWFPPAFWWTLNWWYMTDGYMKFRFNQLLEEYFEIFCWDDPWCICEFRFKKRRDGLTTRRMARTVWKALQTRNGWFGIQSKSGDDAKKVCWKILMTGYRRLPVFFLPQINGSTDPKTMLEFKKMSERITKSNRQKLFENDIFRQEGDDDDLNTTIDWRDTVADAYDGQQTVEINLDEAAKWKKASALEAIDTYKKSCSLDGEKVGMIHAFSSPPEKDGPALEECREIWDSSDYTKIKDLQGFKTYRWLTSSLDSWAGAIDKFGFCDRELAKKLILAERNSGPSRNFKARVRQTPMYIDDIFDNVDNDIFANAQEIRERSKFLKNILYKDPEQKEEKWIYGNWLWRDGMEDTQVYFKPSLDQEDFSSSGRYCLAYNPTEGGIGNILIKKMIKGKECFILHPDSEWVLGIDPYDFKRTDSKKPSLGSGVVGKAFDFFEQGNVDAIGCIYNFRPNNPEDFYEDMIKLAVAYGAYVNCEARNIKIFDHFETRGYFEYMLPKDVMNTKKKDIKGSPTTNNMIQEICAQIEIHTSNNLDVIWFEQLLDEVKDFNPDFTKKYNLVMAYGHMLLGFSKRRRYIRQKRRPQAANIVNELSEAIFDSYF